MRDYSVGVNLIGRDISASKALNKLGFVAKSTGQKLEAASKKANYVIGAMTGAAVLFAKAAAQDEQSASKLAETLKNVTKSSSAQIAGVEKYISTSSTWAAVADDEIRPALDRLVRSTKNVAEAEKLMNLALEISKQKGIPVEQVANALAKAHDGNVNALKRLGVTIKSAGKTQDQYATKMKVVNGKLTETQVKIKSAGKEVVKFSDVVQQLGKDFKGSIAAQSQTAAFKFEQFKVVLGETQETLGYMLLPYLKDLSDWLIKFAPWVERNKENIKKWAIAILSVAIAVKAVNAAYKAFQALQIVTLIAKQIALWAGYGTTVATAGGEIAAAGVAAEVAWAPFLLTIAAVAAAFVGINLALSKLEAKRKAQFDKIKKEGWASTDLKNMYGITDEDLKSIASKQTFMSAAPRHAKGGIVTKPHIGWVGEAGPEAIIPLSKAGGFGGLGGITIVNQVHGSIMTEKEVAVVIRNNIAQLLRRKGLSTAFLGV